VLFTLLLTLVYSGLTVYPALTITSNHAIFMTDKDGEIAKVPACYPVRDLSDLGAAIRKCGIEFSHAVVTIDGKTVNADHVRVVIRKADFRY